MTGTGSGASHTLNTPLQYSVEFHQVGNPDMKPILGRLSSKHIDSIPIEELGRELIRALARNEE